MFARWSLSCYTTLLLLCSTCSAADTRFSTPESRLLEIRGFAIGGVGYALATSQGELDLKSLLALPAFRSAPVLEKLFASENSQAKAYGLAGMRLVNRARFKEMLAIALKSHEQVEVWRGCIGGSEPLRNVAEQIDKGEFRFSSKPSSENLSFKNSSPTRHQN